MDAAIMPFMPEVQPSVPVPQAPGKSADTAKAKTGETFSGILSTTLKPTDSEKAADPAKPKAESEPTANLVNLMGMLSLTVPQQPLPTPTGDAKTVAVPDQLTTTNVTSVAVNTPTMPQLFANLAAVSSGPIPTVNQQPAETTVPMVTTPQNPGVLPTSATATATPNIPIQQQPSVIPAAVHQQPTVITTASETTVPQATTTTAVSTGFVPNTNTVEPASVAAPTATTEALNALLGITVEKTKTEQAKTDRPTISAEQGLVLTNVAPDQPPTAVTAASAQSQKSSIITPVGGTSGHNNANSANINAGDSTDSDMPLVTQDSSGNNPTVFAGILEQRSASPTHTAPAASAPAPQTGPDPYNVAGQIVDHAKLITRADNTEMVIRLKPEHLGELTMKIAVENGTISATFHSANPDVRGALEASLTQLKQELSSQGLKVNYVGVYTSLDQFSANDQRGNLYQQTPKQQSKNRGNRDFVEAVESLAGISQSATASGVDYRI